jgi:hypothetical protein
MLDGTGRLPVRKIQVEPWRFDLAIARVLDDADDGLPTRILFISWSA